MDVGPTYKIAFIVIVAVWALSGFASFIWPVFAHITETQQFYANRAWEVFWAFSGFLTGGTVTASQLA